MNPFESWEKWGSQLNEKEFANAWLALGLLSPGMKVKSRQSYYRPFTVAAKIHRSGFEHDLVEKIGQIIFSSKKETPLSWNFPAPFQTVRIGGKPVMLSDIDPVMLANVWSKMTIPPANGIRLMVMNYPWMSPVRPWFHLLSCAELSVSSAYLNLPAKPCEVQLKWPLRFGCLEENPGMQIITKTLLLWPSGELARPVVINRDHANCDVLIYHGNLEQLVRAVQQLPVPLKCNLFMLRGMVGKESTDVEGMLTELADHSRANGVVFLNPELSDDAMAEGVNHFVRHLSHNSSFDQALSEAFFHQIQANPLVFLTTKLARYSIRQIVTKMKRTLLRMPKEVRINIQPSMLEPMNINITPPDFLKMDLENPRKLGREINRMEKAIEFDRESRGARGMAYMNNAIDDAVVPEATQEKRAARFIQSRMFIKKNGKFVEEKVALYKDLPSVIRIRIGPPDQAWMILPDTEFPVEKLPQYMENWSLTVVLSEPDHLEKPLVRKIKLPRDGPSTGCDFSFTPFKEIPFEGRITVLHRGRVIQTCMMKVHVVGPASPLLPGSKMEITDLIPVHSNIGDLEERRQFDMAFVLNHTSDNCPRLTAVAGEHAWLNDLTGCEKIARDLNVLLSNVAISVKDFEGGLDSEESTKLLVQIAQYGRMLHGYIVEDQLDAPGNEPVFAKKEYLQIISTKSETVIPFEFIYDHETPDDDATLCKSWKKSLADGKCRKECKGNQTKILCPLGFWGIAKVIERHTYTPELSQDGKNFFIQSEPSTGRSELSVAGSPLIAASTRVKQELIEEMKTNCTVKFGSPPKMALTWNDWPGIIAADKPRVILALPHTEGLGGMISLEIGGVLKKSIQLNKDFVRPEGAEYFPLVALLGCDTGGTSQDYGSHVSVFRRLGAAVVIGTIATVFGGHAVKVAEMLVSGLAEKSKTRERIGEVIRSVKREALLKGLLMSLCVVAFGDADWKLKNQEE